MRKHTLAMFLAGAALLAQQLTAANAVVEWNRIATDENTAAGTDPLTETRTFAIVHIAIHDAINALDRRYEAYLWDQSIPGTAPEAAVAAAAREVLVKLLPARTASIEAAYAQYLSTIPSGPARDTGIQAGKLAALTILRCRSDDGSNLQTTARAGTKPGDYRPTAPDFFPAFLPGWGKVTPFGLKNSSQFRPEKPYGMESAGYTSDYSEVKAIGEDKSASRTKGQSEIAQFWYENSGQGWNRIARIVAEEKNLDLWQSARLLALVNIAMADGFIGGFEAKYHFEYWRPITAIGEGDVDGNTSTIGQRDWSPFLPTPPVPYYPSTHSVLGAAAAKVLALCFDSDFVTFNMTSGAPFAGITRQFWGFSQAAEENGASRVLAGIHFRNAVKAGMKQGYDIGEYVFNNLLRPVR